jgi:hypothetical protein
MHKVHKTNYSNCTSRAMKIYVTTMEVFKKKDKQDETQFTPKIGGKTSLCPSYFVL